ncbi:enoyl-CoA hydratase/isomerase family protein [Oceanobacillus luteolus]|uniref:Ethylmalonyl-CoA decarboxylase n=1 Tax=Oceanobacillus luteolus TaxID=1274358 RepID=A0ABW4HQF9_9BACI|nr:enoyl-CoA hydratase/isomerase family protein [Oceanobacillus luteolus]MCM3739146.1 enoyl-CoA hydratase/isomerase family protein [Oceanobacillus luteolus]
MGELITYERHMDDYGIIRLNRPEKRNAISMEMTALLKDKIQKAEKDNLKFLIITGAGNTMFAAGGDLSELHGELSSEEAYFRLFPMMEVLESILYFPVPVIAKLNGNALGGGCELATACDIRIAKENTKFGYIQSTIGILPGWGGGALLYEKVQPSFALDWITRGDVLSVQELKDRGWIHQIIEEESWEDEKYLSPYIEKSAQQMRLLKAQYRAVIQPEELRRRMVEEVKASASLWESEAHKKALENFSLRKK